MWESLVDIVVKIGVCGEDEEDDQWRNNRRREAFEKALERFITSFGLIMQKGVECLLFELLI